MGDDVRLMQPLGYVDKHPHYNEVSFVKDGVEHTYHIGDFFFTKLSSSREACVSELLHLWHDYETDQRNARLRLYFYTETGSSSLFTNANEHELLLLSSEQIVVNLGTLPDYLVQESEGRSGLIDVLPPRSSTTEELITSDIIRLGGKKPEWRNEQDEHQQQVYEERIDEQIYGQIYELDEAQEQDIEFEEIIEIEEPVDELEEPIEEEPSVELEESIEEPEEPFEEEPSVELEESIEEPEDPFEEEPSVELEESIEEPEEPFEEEPSVELEESIEEPEEPFEEEPSVEELEESIEEPEEPFEEEPSVEELEESIEEPEEPFEEEPSVEELEESIEEPEEPFEEEPSVEELEESIEEPEEPFEEEPSVEELEESIEEPEEPIEEEHEGPSAEEHEEPSAEELEESSEEHEEPIDEDLSTDEELDNESVNAEESSILDILQDENAFYDELCKFMETRQTPVLRIPNVGCKSINLHRLFRAVQQIGGYEETTRRRLWKRIYNLIQGKRNSSSAASTYRRHYSRLLLPFEQHYAAAVANHNSAHGVSSSSSSARVQDAVVHDSLGISEQAPAAGNADDDDIIILENDEDNFPLDLEVIDDDSPCLFLKVLREGEDELAVIFDKKYANKPSNKRNSKITAKHAGKRNENRQAPQPVPPENPPTVPENIVLEVHPESTLVSASSAPPALDEKNQPKQSAATENLIFAPPDRSEEEVPPDTTSIYPSEPADAGEKQAVVPAQPPVVAMPLTTDFSAFGEGNCFGDAVSNGEYGAFQLQNDRSQAVENEQAGSSESTSTGNDVSGTSGSTADTRVEETRSTNENPDSGTTGSDYDLTTETESTDDVTGSEEVQHKASSTCTPDRGTPGPSRRGASRGRPPNPGKKGSSTRGRRKTRFTYRKCRASVKNSGRRGRKPKSAVYGLPDESCPPVKSELPDTDENPADACGTRGTARKTVNPQQHRIHLNSGDPLAFPSFSQSKAPGEFQTQEIPEQMDTTNQHQEIGDQSEGNFVLEDHGDSGAQQLPVAESGSEVNEMPREHVVVKVTKTTKRRKRRKGYSSSSRKRNCSKHTSKRGSPKKQVSDVQEHAFVGERHTERHFVAEQQNDDCTAVEHSGSGEGSADSHSSQAPILEAASEMAGYNSDGKEMNVFHNTKKHKNKRLDELIMKVTERVRQKQTVSSNPGEQGIAARCTHSSAKQEATTSTIRPGFCLRISYGRAKCDSIEVVKRNEPENKKNEPENKMIEPQNKPSTSRPAAEEPDSLEDKPSTSRPIAEEHDSLIGIKSGFLAKKKVSIRKDKARVEHSTDSQDAAKYQILKQGPQQQNGDTGATRAADPRYVISQSENTEIPSQGGMPAGSVKHEQRREADQSNSQAGIKVEIPQDTQKGHCSDAPSERATGQQTLKREHPKKRQLEAYCLAEKEAQKRSRGLEVVGNTTQANHRPPTVQTTVKLEHPKKRQLNAYGSSLTENTEKAQQSYSDTNRVEETEVRQREPSSATVNRFPAESLTDSRCVEGDKKPYSSPVIQPANDVIDEATAKFFSELTFKRERLRRQMNAQHMLQDGTDAVFHTEAPEIFQQEDPNALVTHPVVEQPAICEELQQHSLLNKGRQGKCEINSVNSEVVEPDDLEIVYEGPGETVLYRNICSPLITHIHCLVKTEPGSTNRSSCSFSGNAEPASFHVVPTVFSDYNQLSAVPVKGLGTFDMNSDGLQDIRKGPASGPDLSDVSSFERHYIPDLQRRSDFPPVSSDFDSEAEGKHIPVTGSNHGFAPISAHPVASSALNRVRREAFGPEMTDATVKRHRSLPRSFPSKRASSCYAPSYDYRSIPVLDAHNTQDPIGHDIAVAKETDMPPTLPIIIEQKQADVRNNAMSETRVPTAAQRRDVVFSTSGQKNPHIHIPSPSRDVPAKRDIPPAERQHVAGIEFRPPQYGIPSAGGQADGTSHLLERNYPGMVSQHVFSVAPSADPLALNTRIIPVPPAVASVPTNEGSAVPYSSLEQNGVSRPHTGHFSSTSSEMPTLVSRPYPGVVLNTTLGDISTSTSRPYPGLVITTSSEDIPISVSRPYPGVVLNTTLGDISTSVSRQHPEINVTSEEIPTSGSRPHPGLVIDTTSEKISPSVSRHHPGLNATSEEITTSDSRPHPGLVIDTTSEKIAPSITTHPGLVISTSSEEISTSVSRPYPGVVLNTAMEDITSSVCRPHPGLVIDTTSEKIAPSITTHPGLVISTSSEEISTSVSRPYPGVVLNTTMEDITSSVCRPHPGLVMSTSSEGIPTSVSRQHPGINASSEEIPNSGSRPHPGLVINTTSEKISPSVSIHHPGLNATSEEMPCTSVSRPHPGVVLDTTSEEIPTSEQQQVTSTTATKKGEFSPIDLLPIISGQYSSQNASTVVADTADSPTIALQASAALTAHSSTLSETSSTVFENNGHEQNRCAHPPWSLSDIRKYVPPTCRKQLSERSQYEVPQHGIFESQKHGTNDTKHNNMNKIDQFYPNYRESRNVPLMSSVQGKAEGNNQSEDTHPRPSVIQHTEKTYSQPPMSLVTNIYDVPRYLSENIRLSLAGYGGLSQSACAQGTASNVQQAYGVTESLNPVQSSIPKQYYDSTSKRSQAVNASVEAAANFALPSPKPSKRGRTAQRRPPDPCVRSDAFDQSLKSYLGQAAYAPDVANCHSKKKRKVQPHKSTIKPENTGLPDTKPFDQKMRPTMPVVYTSPYLSSMAAPRRDCAKQLESGSSKKPKRCAVETPGMALDLSVKNRRKGNTEVADRKVSEVTENLCLDLSVKKCPASHIPSSTSTTSASVRRFPTTVPPVRSAAVAKDGASYAPPAPHKRRNGSNTADRTGQNVHLGLKPNYPAGNPTASGYGGFAPCSLSYALHAPFRPPQPIAHAPIVSGFPRPAAYAKPLPDVKPNVSFAQMFPHMISTCVPTSNFFDVKNIGDHNFPFPSGPPPPPPPAPPLPPPPPPPVTTPIYPYGYDQHFLPHK